MSCSRGSSRPRDGTRISEVSCIGRSVLDHQCQLGISAIKMFSPSTVALIVTDWKEGAFIRTLNLQHYFLMSYHSACSILTIQKVSLLTPLSCGEHRACSNKQSGVKLPAENQTRKLTFHVYSQQWGRSQKHTRSLKHVSLCLKHHNQKNGQHRYFIIFNCPIKMGLQFLKDMNYFKLLYIQHDLFGKNLHNPILLIIAPSFCLHYL